MARRWQLSLGVLAGLVLTVVALWDSATVSAVADRVTVRTETVDRMDRLDGDEPAPSDLAFSDLDGAASGDGFNLLRPTTTTTRPTSTTTSTVVPKEDSVGAGSDDTTGTGTGTGDEPAPGSATTLPADGDGESAGTTDPGGSSSTTAVGDPNMSTVYEEDFSEGALIAGRWSITDSIGNGGWGLLRRSAVAVVADPSAAGGHVLAITARPGTGAEAGQVVSGAVRLLGHDLTHGRYSVRARVDADPDGATGGVVLLQPTSAGGAAATSDEIRIIETSRNRATRSPVESTSDGSVPAARSRSAKPIARPTDRSRPRSGTSTPWSGRRTGSPSSSTVNRSP